MLVNFSSTLNTYWTFLGQKKSIEFSPNFSPFFTARPTSQRYNDPLKVIPEGSMVEYLPVGPKGAPKTIFGKKYFRPEIPNPLSQPSVQYRSLFA